MNKKISLSLSVASIKDTIKKIEKAQRLVEEAKINGIKETLDGAYETIIINSPMDTGATIASTNVEMNSKKAKITQTGDHVFENEFGDGSLAGNYPGERPSSFPTHQSDYFFIPTDTTSKYYPTYKAKKRALHSYGQVAHAQMYHGSQYIRNNISKIIKKKVSGALSKI